MKQKFKLTGTWYYSPKLLGNRNEKWWLIISCNTGIAKYYRHLFYIHKHKCQKLIRGTWEEHITIVRDEEPPHKDLWEKYHGQTVDFYVTPESHTNGEYFWLPVECPQAIEMRIELGLSPKPYYDFHLSYGHIV